MCSICGKLMQNDQKLTSKMEIFEKNFPASLYYPHFVLFLRECFYPKIEFFTLPILKIFTRRAASAFFLIEIYSKISADQILLETYSFWSILNNMFVACVKPAKICHKIVENVPPFSFLI